MTVSGRIIRSFNYQDKSVFFNFDPDYQNTLTLVLLKSDFDALGGAEELQEQLTNKTVRIHRTITLYQEERIQIRLRDPAQILDVE